MLSSPRYIEDIFSDFYHASIFDIDIQHQDQSASQSFYASILDSKPLTQNQANFLLKILDKYKVVMARHGLDYQDDIKTPKWKSPFRIIDLTKSIWVEQDEHTVPVVCMKFPYQIKAAFESEFRDLVNGTWDHERKMRRVSIYKCNLIQLHDFSVKHNFEIDDTLLIALGEVEEIWAAPEEISPASALIADWVTLLNSSNETNLWWNEHCTGNYSKDLMLAKSMGYCYEGMPFSTVEKIAASQSNAFWIKTNKELLDLHHRVGGKMCIVLDRVSDTINWLTKFAEDIDRSDINRNKVRVCFRAEKGAKTDINEWIKDNGFGGKVEDGDILIFEQKPAKWLFKEQDSVTLLVTNNIYPPTSMIAKDWFNTHPCVIFLGDIKPSEQKGQPIVEL
jgi:hypothetical protein